MKDIGQVKTWRCELYADVLLQYPCLTFHIQAVDFEQATATMRMELENIQVLLRPGVILEETDSSVHFEEGERIRAIRYIPDLQLAQRKCLADI